MISKDFELPLLRKLRRPWCHVMVLPNYIGGGDNYVDVYHPGTTEPRHALSLDSGGYAHKRINLEKPLTQEEAARIIAHNNAELKMHPSEIIATNRRLRKELQEKH